ncbi:MAG: TIGR00701 family protein [Rhodobacterales bacterium CG18_big_fil_WC_8_21_14_2_50_71_9]|nr:MAG: TIGR00701 family protein [Rhodobacterales bacterium CG18_big_fil_WC_8_21_14_2_50_71_9]
MYEVVKVIHILAWTSWMAGLFYLPRIFVYHAENGTSERHTSETFKIMERKLFRYIMKPSMIATWITGFWLAFVIDVVDWRNDVWFWLKVALVVALTIQHQFLGRWMESFARDENRHSGKFYRVANEVPTLLFIGIVTLIILRPF